MNKSAIEWCDKTWNPITGCLHNCEYCYARYFTNRFDGKRYWETDIANGFAKCSFNERTGLSLPTLNEPLYGVDINSKTRKLSFPYNFYPTFHRYRLDQPAKIKKPQTIFVGSMCDLFGEWVPDKWIEEVFKSCEAAPQHRYLFLTKNQIRYMDYNDTKKSPYWLGATATTVASAHAAMRDLNSFNANTFLSLEPLLENINLLDLHYFDSVKWVIIGAMTGPGSKYHQPKQEWVSDIVDACRAANVPVFLKNNLAKVWGEPLIQEFPFQAIYSRST